MKVIFLASFLRLKWIHKFATHYQGGGMQEKNNLNFFDNTFCNYMNSIFNKRYNLKGLSPMRQFTHDLLTNVRYSIRLFSMLGILAFSASNAMAQNPDNTTITGNPVPTVHESLNTAYQITVAGTSEYGVYSLGALDDQTQTMWMWYAVGCGPSAIHTWNMCNQADGYYSWTGYISNCDTPTVLTADYIMYGDYITP